MKDVIVIGSGFWGSAIARKLKKAGLDYTVLDNGDGHSGTRNSGAYTCLRWFDSGTILKHIPENWTKEKVRRWVTWLVKQGYLELTGQWIYNKRLKTWKRYEDCYVMRDVSRFSNRTKAIAAEVLNIEMRKDRCRVNVMRLGSPAANSFDAKYVVMATGSWTDKILERSNLPISGTTTLIGRAVLLKPNKIKLPFEWKGEVLSINTRPFKNFDLIPNAKNWWYFGATTEKEASEKAYDEMLTAAVDLVGDSAEITTVLVGFRPILDNGVRQINDRVIVATGGGRIGLALAGPAADDVVSLIKGSY